MRGLQGKVVVVAGAGSGIGAATAAPRRGGRQRGRRRPQRAEREKVAAGIAERGGTAIAVTFDIADEASVVELIGAAVSAYGGIDGVHVNAADLSPGTVGRDSDAVSLPLEVFDRTIEVNLRGHLLVTQRAVPELLAHGGDAIVYTSSASAFNAGRRLPSYAVAKSGLLALNRHVASRWGKEGVRANAIAPGFVRTETNLRGMRDDFQTKALKSLP